MSLLQSSLTVVHVLDLFLSDFRVGFADSPQARTERTQEQEQALFATPAPVSAIADMASSVIPEVLKVSGIQPSWLWEVEGLSNYGSVTLSLGGGRSR